MAIDPASSVVASIGPPQDIAYVPVDIGAAAPLLGITSGRALASVLVSSAGALAVPISEAGMESALRSTALSTAGGAQAGSTALMTLLPANANRKGAAIGNNAGATLLVDLSTSLSTSQYLAPLAASGGYYEAPFGYAGAVYGMLTAASTLNVTAREVI